MSIIVIPAIMPLSVYNPRFIVILIFCLLRKAVANIGKKIIYPTNVYGFFYTFAKHVGKT